MSLLLPLPVDRRLAAALVAPRPAIARSGLGLDFFGLTGSVIAGRALDPAGRRLGWAHWGPAGPIVVDLSGSGRRGGGWHRFRWISLGTVGPAFYFIDGLDEKAPVGGIGGKFLSEERDRFIGLAPPVQYLGFREPFRGPVSRAQQVPRPFVPPVESVKKVPGRRVVRHDGKTDV